MYKENRNTSSHNNFTFDEASKAYRTKLSACYSSFIFEWYFFEFQLRLIIMTITRYRFSRLQQTNNGSVHIHDVSKMLRKTSEVPWILKCSSTRYLNELFRPEIAHTVHSSSLFYQQFYRTTIQ